MILTIQMLMKITNSSYKSTQQIHKRVRDKIAKEKGLDSKKLLTVEEYCRHKGIETGVVLTLLGFSGY